MLMIKRTKGNGIANILHISSHLVQTCFWPSKILFFQKMGWRSWINFMEGIRLIKLIPHRFLASYLEKCLD